MGKSDTIRLLRECDAGAKMGAAAINDVIDRVCSPALRDALTECRNAHEALGAQVRTLLRKNRTRCKDPSAFARSMACAKTKIRLTLRPGDKTIADLMSDGCSMGIKTLCRCQNKYKTADEASSDLVQHLIALEETLEQKLRAYL